MKKKKHLKNILVLHKILDYFLVSQFQKEKTKDFKKTLFFAILKNI